MCVPRLESWVIQRKRCAPIDRQNHDSSMALADVRPDWLIVQLHVDLAAESVDRMREMEAFHSLRELLANSMNHEYQVCWHWAYVFHLASVADLLSGSRCGSLRLVVSNVMAYIHGIWLGWM